MSGEFYIYLIIMVLTTYCIRVLPFTIFRKKIENRFFKSFLAYVPYAVLAAMTFPSIIYSTDSYLSAVAGFLVAIMLSVFERGLVTVAICASLVVYFVEIIL